MSIHFTPKTPTERQEFLQQADAAKTEDDREERRLRREWLPTLSYPFQEPISHSEIVVERSMVPMRDGVALRTHIYRPVAQGCYPVLLLRGPYDMNATIDKAPALLREMARRGYVGVAQDVRGRFGSEGDFVALVNEHEDTFDAVEWCAAQSWSNGRVGMCGISYLGFTSYCAAVTKPRGLVAVMPSCIKYGNEHLSNVPGLGSACAWFQWAGQPTSTLQNFRRLDWQHLPLNKIGAEAGLDHPSATMQLEERGFPNSLSCVEISRRLQSIEVPSQIICGWYDEFITENLLNYERQANAGGDVRLVVGPWHHNLEDQIEPRMGKVPVPEPPANRYYAEMERFFNHYLKAGTTKPLEAPGPVLLHVLGIHQWRYEQEWPLCRAVTTSLYLSSRGNANTEKGDGLLSWEPPVEHMSDHYSYNPLDPVRSVEGVSIWNLFTDGELGDRSAIEARQDVLVFSTPVLEQDIEVTGTIQVVLHAASSAPDTDFVINLIDVYPDGHTQYLCNGIMRVTYRDGLEERKLVEPGRIVEYCFALRPISNCFQKGHRIRIEVTSSDMDRYARNQNVADSPGTTADVAIASQVIHHGGTLLSRLELPIIPTA